MELQINKLRAELIQHVAYGLLAFVHQHVAEHGWNDLAVKDALMLLGEIKDCKIVLGEDLTDTNELMARLQEEAAV